MDCGLRSKGCSVRLALLDREIWYRGFCRLTSTSFRRWPESVSAGNLIAVESLVMVFEAGDLAPWFFLLLFVEFCAKIFTLQSSNSIRMLKKDLFIYGEKTVKRKMNTRQGSYADQLLLLLHLQFSLAKSYRLRHTRQSSMCLMIRQNAAISETLE